MYAPTFPHCNMKSTEYFWPKTRVSGQFLDLEKSVIT